MSTFERRFIQPDVNLTDTDADTAQRFNGTAIVYNSRTAIGNPATWGFFEEIAPGAAEESIQRDDIALLVNHSTMHVVSRTGAGTLSLADTPTGVSVDSALDTDLSYVNDLRVNLRNKNVSGMSFGFNVPKGGDTWSTVTMEARDDKGDTIQIEAELRTIQKLTLMEVSAVTFPAYTDTDAYLRDAPVLAERRDRYTPPSALSEADKAVRDYFERSSRYLAARYNLPTGK